MDEHPYRIVNLSMLRIVTGVLDGVHHVQSEGGIRM